MFRDTSVQTALIKPKIYPSWPSSFFDREIVYWFPDEQWIYNMDR